MHRGIETKSASLGELMKMTKYAQNLEHIIRFKNKEIQRLEYLNKFLVIAQQKRDDMLSHTLEENRHLKELALHAEKLQKGYEKRQKHAKSPNLYFNASSPTYKKPSGLTHLKQSVSPRTQKPESRLNRLQTAGQNKRNIPELSNSLGHLKFFDDRKSQSILKMSRKFPCSFP